MKNKFLTIFLGIIISLSFANYCFAIKAPDSPMVPEESIGEGSAVLTWHWDENEEIKQFKILWREWTEDSSQDWLARYPSAAGGPNYSYSLRGLDAGTEYEWRIKAEAPDPSKDSVYVEGETFITNESQFVFEDDGPEDIPLTNPFEGIGNLKEAADALMEFLLIVGFAVGPILIIYAAFLLLTKQGDPTAITKAKQIILWTVISLSIMLFAKGVPSVVKDIFK